MSTVKTNNVQVGTSGTATNNFTWYQPATPDGTVRLGVGNTGATTADVVTATSDGNVGIGTSAPYDKLHIVGTNTGNITSEVYSSSSYPSMQITRGRGTAALPTAVQSGDTLGRFDFNGFNNVYSAFTAATIQAYASKTFTSTDWGGYLVFYTSNVTGSGGTAERMRIDQNGNVGIGTSSPPAKFAVSNGGAAGFEFSPTGGISSGTYIQSYNRSTSAYVQNTNYALGHTWYAASTRAMDIDSSGNVGIGTSSPTDKLTVAGVVRSTGGSAVTASGPVQSGNLYYGWEMYNVDSTQNYLQSYNRSSNAYMTSVYNAGTHRFLSSGVESARIDSSGNLLVGTTSASGKFHSFNASGDASQPCIYVQNNKNFSGIQGINVSSGNIFNDTGHEFLSCNDIAGGGATRMTVRSNGGIANYQANNVNLSDRREKTNFSPAGEYLSKICAIPVQTFNYADQNLEEDPGLTLGVVAQDVQAVAPELVMESNWGTEEEPKQRLSIYQTDLQYALMKCIQEQQATIESLTARIAALEAK